MCTICDNLEEAADILDDPRVVNDDRLCRLIRNLSLEFGNVLQSDKVKEAAFLKVVTKGCKE